MGAARVKDAPPLVDLGDCRDIFVSRVARIERLAGGNLRFIFVVDEEDEHGNKRSTVVDRQVWHMSAIPTALRLTMDAIADKPMLAENGDILVMTH